MSGARSYSMCMNVRGFLRNNRFPKDFREVFTSDDGRVLSPQEAHDFLMDESAKGHVVIPMSAECGNPCSRAQLGCVGFDYAGRGCPGYQTPEQPKDTTHGE